MASLFHRGAVSVSLLLWSFFQVWTLAHSHSSPAVFIAIIARNAEATLPFVLGGLELQDYPPDRLYFWIRTDCNADNTTQMLEKWTAAVEKTYAKVDFAENECWRPMDKHPFQKDDEHRRHVESLRDDALEYARSLRLDYILFIDSGAFLVEPTTITDLVASNELIIAPFLPSLNKYGNFWCNVTGQNRFMWSEDCSHVFEFESVGIFGVSLVHTVILINIKSSKTQGISFTSDSPSTTRPYQKFLLEANRAGVKIALINKKQYGYCLPPLSEGSQLKNQKEAMENLQLEVLVYRNELPKSSHLQVEFEDLDTLGFGHVYLINLDRRTERKERIEKSFAVLGLEVERIRGVDGRNLDLDFLKGMGVKMLEGYADPYKQRPMTMGEYGCFLSHYAIWRDMLDKGYENILVFEDDIRFENYFRQRLLNIWKEIDRLNLEWDLIYLGRKRLVEESEPFVHKTKLLVHVGYSYWTLSYMLSKDGARKLLRGEPLSKMIPVDEYLPVMFNRHPNEAWKKAFPVRDVIAFSAFPLLIYPSHYTGETGYVSDTENSDILEITPEEYQVHDSALHDEL